MPKRTLFIAAYDVSSPARLRQSLKVLKGYATGGQKSVFECFLSDAEQQSLLAEIRDVINPRDDRFLLIRPAARSGAKTLGIARRPADPDYFYVG